MFGCFIPIVNRTQKKVWLVRSILIIMATIIGLQWVFVTRNISWETLHDPVMRGLQIGCIMAVSFLVTQLTSSFDVSRAIARILSPLRFLGLKVDESAFVIAQTVN